MLLLILDQLVALVSLLESVVRMKKLLIPQPNLIVGHNHVIHLPISFKFLAQEDGANGIQSDKSSLIQLILVQTELDHVKVMPKRTIQIMHMIQRDQNRATTPKQLILPYQTKETHLNEYNKNK